MTKKNTVDIALHDPRIRKTLQDRERKAFEGGGYNRRMCLWQTFGYNYGLVTLNTSFISTMVWSDNVQ